MERDFKGVWIPKDIWLDTRLNALEKVILVEIDSLDNGEDGCYASNTYLAEFCQCSQTKVSTAVSKLMKYGYVEQVEFDGRHRKIKSRLSKNERQDLNILKTDIKKINANNIDNKQENNKDIDILAEQYNVICLSLPKCKKVTDGRRKKIKMRLKEFSVDDIMQAFQKAEQSDFLSGRDGKWQACSFDWFFKNDENIAKVLEGKYDNRQSYSRDELELQKAYEEIRRDADGNGFGFGE